MILIITESKQILIFGPCSLLDELYRNLNHQLELKQASHLSIRAQAYSFSQMNYLMYSLVLFFYLKTNLIKEKAKLTLNEERRLAKKVNF